MSTAESERDSEETTRLIRAAVLAERAACVRIAEEFKSPLVAAMIYLRTKFDAETRPEPDSALHD
jgi:hypothetical protein